MGTFPVQLEGTKSNKAKRSTTSTCKVTRWETPVYLHALNIMNKTNIVYCLPNNLLRDWCKGRKTSDKLYKSSIRFAKAWRKEENLTKSVHELNVFIWSFTVEKGPVHTKHLHSQKKQLTPLYIFIPATLELDCLLRWYTVEWAVSSESVYMCWPACDNVSRIIWYIFLHIQYIKHNPLPLSKKK